MPKSEPPSELLSLLKTEAAQGPITFARFMEMCLYHPRLGYYRKAARRIGYGEETDFFTSSSSGRIFGEGVAAACVSLLAGSDPGDFTFVEVGAEPGPPGGRGVLAGVAHPFRSVKIIGIGELGSAQGDATGTGTPFLESNRIVFSNELFDAQPFHRFLFREGRWREIGVAFEGDVPIERELQAATAAPLPASAPEGYRIDAPLASVRLLDSLLSAPWNGLFVAFDYGKSWNELCAATPQGTARAYFRHRQSFDLLAQPGDQDLTCHVCWDWLSDSLIRHGFEPARCESQESFFVGHASGWLESNITHSTSALDARKRSVMQLIHPSHLGQRFQVLHARRPAPLA